MSEQPSSGVDTDAITATSTGPRPESDGGSLNSFAPPTRPRPSTAGTGPAYLPPVPPPGQDASQWSFPSQSRPPSQPAATGVTEPMTTSQPITFSQPRPSSDKTTRRFAPTGPPGPPVGPGTPAATARGAAAGRWGWRALVAFLAGGLVAASGFAASQLTMEEDDVAGPASTTVLTEAGISDAQDAASQGVLPPVDVEEPAAYVAQILAPSVVQVETDFGLGSGVVYGDGLIITNNHVIDGSNTQSVRLADGRTLQAEIVGTDPNTDIAVLSVGEGAGLAVAELAVGDEIDVGQIAVAIGSPFQLQQSVTAGIVSAVNRPVPNREGTAVVAMIQTDAPINPGNSGGALADKEGRVIGINTAIQTDGLSGTNAGVGFAVPIDTAVRIANLLVAGEPIESGFLGVTGADPADGSAGVEIDSIEPDSAAARAGLEVGDRVLSIDDAPVTAIEELAGLVLAQQAGDEVTLKVVRNGEDLEIDATLGARSNGN